MDLRSFPPFPGSFRSIPTSDARLIQRSTVWWDPIRQIWVLLDEGSEQSNDGTDADSAENDAYSRRVPADKPEYSPDRVDHADDHELTALRTEVRNLRELADYRGELLKDAEWRYQELLQQLKLSQETSATLARALPESAGSPNSGRTPRRRWWPFGQR